MGSYEVLVQPKSSLHRLWKYPTDRVGFLRGPADWIEGKRRDDNIGKLWRVHDKLYDLTKFINYHPGGSQYIELTRGLDITESFESAHFINVPIVEALLSKYYVSEAATPRNSPYTFKPDGFYKTLKKAAEPILKQVGTGPTRSAKFIQDGIFLVFLILSSMGVWYNSTSVKILAGVTLAMTINAAHNFTHLKENWRRFYMDFSFLSSTDSRVVHSFSHHMYPNTVLDAEMSLSEPIFCFMPDKSKNWFQRYGPILYCHPIWLLFHWIILSVRSSALLRSKTRFEMQNLIVLLEIVYFAFIASSVSDAITSWATIHTACSYYFGLFTFAGGHHHPTSWHDGDESRPDPDFGLCQMDAIRERSDSIYQNLFIVMTRFGDHSLHHLFPTVCHSKLHFLKPALDETLLKFKHEILGLPDWKLFIGLFQQLQNTEPAQLSQKIKNN